MAARITDPKELDSILRRWMALNRLRVCLWTVAMAGDGGVLRAGVGRLALPRAAAPGWLRLSSTWLFYGYVGLLILAGAWGIVFGDVYQRMLLHLDLGDLAPGTRADVMS